MLGVGHEVAVSRLKVLVYLGIIRSFNNLFNAAALNNWS